MLLRGNASFICLGLWEKWSNQALKDEKCRNPSREYYKTAALPDGFSVFNMQKY